jgi:heptosyltransferase-1
MGDIIHTLPALTDAGRAIPGIRFDWVVENAFADIPRWHPSVDSVIPVAIRRWRKDVLTPQTRHEWKQLRAQLQEQQYDLILDAQGLVKSAFLAFFASGVRAGLNWKSARESLASLAYQRKYSVNFYQHAIVRMRALFSAALGYELPQTAPDFNINRQSFPALGTEEPYIVFLYGTTWASKQWPELYWQRLAVIAKNAGYKIKLSGNDAEEFARAARIAKDNPAVDVLPRLDIKGMAALLAHAKAAVAVDTGFGHLAAALNLPIVSIYGSTNPEYTGALGDASIHLSADFACAPCLRRECNYKKPAEVTPACYTTVTPERVWAALSKII